jgi:hypothetical protein
LLKNTPKPLTDVRGFHEKAGRVNIFLS